MLRALGLRGPAVHGTTVPEDECYAPTVSISDDERRGQKRAVLLRMLRDLGDHDVRDMYVSVGELDYADILPTTWRELLDDGLIDDGASTMGAARFQLTTHGWIRALILSKMVDEPAFRDRCARLVGVMKAVVKGRGSHHDAFAHVQELASAGDVPEGWTCNAIRGRLLQRVFPKDRWDAEYDKQMVRISPTFGLNHLELEGET
ncbi:MAG: hypothetical protein JW395_3133 [Nitrospira sp.]|nr:hypothetical protein [Nitrospira sp.]